MVVVGCEDDDEFWGFEGSDGTLKVPIWSKIGTLLVKIEAKEETFKGGWELVELKKRVDPVVDGSVKNGWNLEKKRFTKMEDY